MIKCSTKVHLNYPFSDLKGMRKRPNFLSVNIFLLLISLTIMVLSTHSQTTDSTFPMPPVDLISQKTMEGRKVLRYEHQSHADWGYANPQRDYFNVVLPIVDTVNQVPLRVILHSAGHSGDVAMEEGFARKEEFLQYYGDERFFLLYLDCRTNQSTDWWWGWYSILASGDTYKAKMSPTEKRAISTIEWVVNKYNIDRNRIYLSGTSMGGSGSLGLGMWRGDIFAAINVIVPAGVDHMFFRMKNGTHPDPPPVINFSSQIDEWAEGQDEFLAYTATNKYLAIFAWGPFGHTGSVPTTKSVVIDFPWLDIKKNEAYPVFTGASVNDKYPGFKNRTSPDQKGQINGYFRWSNMEDNENTFAMKLRLVTKNELTVPAEIPAMAEADITLRRLQHFQVNRTTKYKWSLLRNTDTLQTGEIITDNQGLITIQGLKIEGTPAVLTIKPSLISNTVKKDWKITQAPPKVEKSGSVLVFTFDEGVSSISIFDITGKKIRSIEVTERKASWNGIDAEGQKTARGVYIGTAGNRKFNFLFTVE